MLRTLACLLLTLSAQVQAKTIGALYTATNVNSGNAVQVYALDDTGSLTYSTSVATGGMGSSSTGGDSLFSQDSIAVEGNYLFVCNAGSNTLSLFSISPSNPTSISLITSAPTAGSLGLQFPIAVSVNPSLPIACVLNGGAMNGVVCFTYSATALTPITGLQVAFNQAGLSTPPVGPRNTFSDLSWTDDGSALVVSYKGFSADAPGFVLSYRVTGVTAETSTFGALQNTTIPGAVGPFSITPIRAFGAGATAGNAFFVTDPLGTSIDTFSIVKSTAVVTGVNATVIPTAGICWSEVSPSTNSYVAVGRGFSQLTFSDSLAVTVTNSVSFPGGNGGLDSSIATIAGMDFLFVLSPGNSSLFVYSLPSASSANYIGSFPLMSASVKHQGLASYIITPQPIGALYTATNLNSANAVQVYAVDATGAATYSTTVATGGMGSSSTGGDSLFSQDSIAVHGNYLFVCNAGSNTLSLFSISPSNPTSISLITSSPTSGSLGLQFPIAVSVNPSLPIACVLNGGMMNGIVCFTYSATALTPITGLQVSFNQAGLSTPPVGPRNTFSDLSWTDDGSALVVSYKGFSAAAPGFVLSYRVTGVTAETSTFGATQNTTIPGAVGPFSITPIRAFGAGATSGNAFFVTDPLGTSIDTFSIVKSTAIVTGVNATVIPTAGICWSEVSPSTNSYVAVGRGFSQLTFSDSLAVTVTNSVSFPGGNGGLDSSIATIAGMDFLFVLSPGNSSLFVYSLPSANSANYIGSYPIMSASVKHQGLASYIMTSSTPTPSSSSSSSSSSSASNGMSSSSSSSSGMPMVSSSSAGMSSSSSSSSSPSSSPSPSSPPASSSTGRGPNSAASLQPTLVMAAVVAVMTWMWA